MKIMPWNVRGLNDPDKRHKINSIISGVCPNWSSFQESKLREVTNPIIGWLLGGTTWALLIFELWIQLVGWYYLLLELCELFRV